MGAAEDQVVLDTFAIIGERHKGERLVRVLLDEAAGIAISFLSAED